jgi:hypothetical protein
MKQTSLSEADSSSASQNIPHILRNLDIHYCVHTSPPLYFSLCCMKPVHNLTHYSFYIYSNIIYGGGERRGVYSVLVERSEGKRPLGRPSVGGRITLRWTLRRE